MTRRFRTVLIRRTAGMRPTELGSQSQMAGPAGSPITHWMARGRRQLEGLASMENGTMATATGPSSSTRQMILGSRSATTASHCASPAAACSVLSHVRMRRAVAQTDLSSANQPTVAALWATLNASLITSFASRSPAALLGPCNASCASAYWTSLGSTSSHGPICGVPGCTGGGPAPPATPTGLFVPIEKCQTPPAALPYPSCVFSRPRRCGRTGLTALGSRTSGQGTAPLPTYPR